MKNNQSGFIGIGSMDISKHFDRMESRGLWICKKCTEMYFLQNEQRYPFNKGWFEKHLGFGFTGFGVQMISLWICKVGYTWRNGPLFEVVQKVLRKIFINYVMNLDAYRDLNHGIWIKMGSLWFSKVHHRNRKSRIWQIFVKKRSLEKCACCITR